MTGTHYTCVLIDGTVRRFPLERVKVDTPYYKGVIDDMCLQSPIYDVIIGNVPGARLSESPEKAWKPEDKEVFDGLKSEQIRRLAWP